MQHVEIVDFCQKILADRFKILVDDIPLDPWDKVISDFAARPELQKWAKEYVWQEFSGLIDATNIKYGLDLRRPPEFSEAMQRHHDRYMRLKLLGQLPGDDYGQYAEAERREELGEVVPFSKRKKVTLIVQGFLGKLGIF